MKAFKKQNNMLFIMAERAGSRHEVKKINNIHAKALNKYESSISDGSIIYSDSSLSS